jgi:uncharacterized protein YbjT (DUF2867 family)
VPGLKVLLIGASGSAGGCVLRQCLVLPHVSAVRAIVRRPLDVAHAKLTVVIHEDYLSFAGVSAAFAGVDACFYCLGKSVRQVSSEAEYRRVTHDFALAAARALHTQSPSAVFHFISGEGASLTSRFMWARVKAETERDLGPFEAVCWRPGLIDGMGSASEPGTYKIMRPIGRLFFSGSRRWYVTGDDIGRAMIAAAAKGVRDTTFENAGIRDLAAGLQPA